MLSYTDQILTAMNRGSKLGFFRVSPLSKEEEESIKKEVKSFPIPYDVTFEHLPNVTFINLRLL